MGSVPLLLSWSLPRLPGIPPLSSPALTTSIVSPGLSPTSPASPPQVLLSMHPAARHHDSTQQGTSNTHPLPCHTCYFTWRSHCSRFGFWYLLRCHASALCHLNCFVFFSCSLLLALRSQHMHYNMFVICRDRVKKLDWDHGVNQTRMQVCNSCSCR